MKRLRLLFSRKPLLIAISGHSRPQDHERSLAEGFDHHLVKPVPPEQLYGILKKHAPESEPAKTEPS
jgi:CheY-like chemotaxis protein